MKKSRNW